MRWLNSLLLFLLFCFQAHAQSSFDRTIASNGFEEVVITLHNTFQIEITSAETSDITYNAISEGEYQDHLLIRSTIKEKKLYLQDDVQPFSQHHNDKLSAHKVYAVKVVLQIPSHLKVTVKSNTASLKIDGGFKNLFAEFSAGNCILEAYQGHATINTIAGDITLTTKNATVKAATKTGKIRSQNIYGPYKINLTSISGDISVYKTK